MADDAQTRTRRFGIVLHLLREERGLNAAITAERAKVAVDTFELGRPGRDRQREACRRLVRESCGNERGAGSGQGGRGQARGPAWQGRRHQTGEEL